MTNEDEILSLVSFIYKSTVECMDELGKMNIGKAKSKLNTIMNSARKMNDISIIIKTHSEKEKIKSCENCIHSYFYKELETLCCNEGISMDSSSNIDCVEESFVCKYYIEKD